MRYLEMSLTLIHLAPYSCYFCVGTAVVTMNVNWGPVNEKQCQGGIIYSYIQLQHQLSQNVKKKNMFFLAYFTLVPRTTQTQAFLCQYNHMYLCYAGTLTCKHHRRVIKDNSFPAQHCSTKHFQRSCTLGKEDKIYIPIRPHGRNMHQHFAAAFML